MSPPYLRWPCVQCWSARITRRTAWFRPTLQRIGATPSASDGDGVGPQGHQADTLMCAIPPVALSRDPEGPEQDPGKVD